MFIKLVKSPRDGVRVFIHMLEDLASPVDDNCGVLQGELRSPITFITNKYPSGRLSTEPRLAFDKYCEINYE